MSGRDYFAGCTPSPSGGRGAPRGAAAASPFGPPVEWDACACCGQPFAAGYASHQLTSCDACAGSLAPSPSTTSSLAFVDVVARIALAPKEAT